MRKYSFLGLAGLLCLSAFTACSDDDPTPIVAIKEVRITPADNAVAVSCTGTAYSSELDNRKDSIGYDVPVENLKQATMQVTTTTGIGIEAFYQGKLIDKNLIVDATQPIQLEVKGYGQTRSYTVHVLQASGPGEEPTLKSSDMRLMGVQPTALDFDVTYFNDKFYAVAPSKKGEVVQYLLYSSENGIKWNEVKYTCNNAEGKPCNIGGRGARLEVFGNRMYVLGGVRSDGPDEYGNKAELEQGWFGPPSPSPKAWRSFSTTDGKNFQVDSEQAGKNHPSPSFYSTAFTFKDKLYYQGGLWCTWGMLQGCTQFWCSTDGKAYEKVSPDYKKLESRHHAAFFEFNNKLWVVGGYNSFTGESMTYSDIYSSTDGATWVKEAENSALGKIFGAKVVKATNNVLYLFGGAMYEDGKQVISKKVFRSTDAINWEEVKISSTYVARRSPKVIVKGNMAYIFGGYAEPTSGNYAAPTDKDTLFDLYIMTLK